MSKIDPIIKVFTTNANFVSKYVQKPNFVKINPSELRLAPPLQADVVQLSATKKSVNIDDVRKMFPAGKLDESENNFLLKSIKEFLEKLKQEEKLDLKRKIIDLTPELSDKDYGLMQQFMNLHNGKYIDLWNETTDGLANKEKLALFVRTMRLTKQGETFLKFNPAEWDVAVEGIVKKPKQFVNALLDYKFSSKKINKALSDHSLMTPELKEKINAITEYLKMFETKNDIIVYRGDGSFDILQKAEINRKELNLAEIIQTATNNFQQMHKNEIYDKSVVDEFANKFLKESLIKQSRFMSTAMDKSGSKQYAEKIFWTIKVPKGTKGTSIESFNIERLNEAEFLGQRDGIFRIKGATYNPEENMWYLDAVIEQGPLTKI